MDFWITLGLCGCIVVTALFVIATRNAVYSVIGLIACCLGMAITWGFLGSEFMGMILAIVYVGAVAVFFLFVVMMIPLNTATYYVNTWRWIIGGGILVLSGPYYLFFESTYANPSVLSAALVGKILYGKYAWALQIMGLILFVSMIGAILLIPSSPKTNRRQIVRDQVRRKPQDTLTLHTITSGSGVSIPKDLT
jgi:NADH-quinone oxidoreductase subunit J